MTTEADPGWGVYSWEGKMHVAPVSEAERHIDHDCPCGAHENEDGIIVHYAFDGRHEFENGTRKVS